jgi:hypothetical protein
MSGQTLRFCILCLIFMSSLSQSNAQTVEPYMKGKDRVFYTYSYAFIQPGIESYESTWRSNENLIQLYLETKIARKFFVGYGFGYNSTNYHHNLRISTQPTTGGNTFHIIPDSVSYNSNKLNVKYLEIPIELRFRTQTHSGKTIRCYIGAKVGYRINSYARYRDEKLNVAYYNIDELNQWNYGLYTRMGYGLISLYASYSLSPLFTNLSEVQSDWANQNVISFGLSIGG